MMEPLRSKADVYVNTSDFNVHEFRRWLSSQFADLEEEPSLRVRSPPSASKTARPATLDLMFDVRFLPNPYWVPELRNLIGTDRRVREDVMSLADARGFWSGCGNAGFPDPRYRQEGKSYVSIGIGCTGGRHRSVALAEELGDWLREQNHHPAVRHRDAGNRPNAPATGKCRTPAANWRGRRVGERIVMSLRWRRGEVDGADEEGGHLRSGYGFVGAVVEGGGGAASGYASAVHSFDGPVLSSGPSPVASWKRFWGSSTGWRWGEGGDHHDGHVGSGYYSAGVEVSVGEFEGVYGDAPFGVGAVPGVLLDTSLISMVLGVLDGPALADGAVEEGGHLPVG